ncbi:MAG TPA: biotin transporter BioY [Treponemataceae bacterium]|nr:biotin transporter BioY [Treponemataceae bacterium]
MKKRNIKSVFTALFAALICTGAVIAIPVGPVPIVLQNAFAVLAGLLLGPIQGAGAVGLFLLAGSLGLPVFSGGKSGFVVIAGPTGGYLIGYFIAALIGGYAIKQASLTDGKKALPIVISATIAAFASIYIPGVLVLKQTLNMTISMAISRGFVPFLIGDAIKIVAIVPITLKLRPLVARYLDENS